MPRSPSRGDLASFVAECARDFAGKYHENKLEWHNMTARGQVEALRDFKSYLDEIEVRIREQTKHSAESYAHELKELEKLI